MHWLPQGPLLPGPMIEIIVQTAEHTVKGKVLRPRALYWSPFETPEWSCSARCAPNSQMAYIQFPDPMFLMPILPDFERRARGSDPGTWWNPTRRRQPSPWRHRRSRRPGWRSGAISGTGIRSQPNSAPGRRAAGAAAPRWPGFRAPLNHTMRPSKPPSRNHPGPAIERPAHDVKRNRHRPDIAATAGPQAQARSDQRTGPPRFNPRTRRAFLPWISRKMKIARNRGRLNTNNRRFLQNLVSARLRVLSRMLRFRVPAAHPLESPFPSGGDPFWGRGHAVAPNFTAGLASRWGRRVNWESRKIETAFPMFSTKMRGLRLAVKWPFR